MSRPIVLYDVRSGRRPCLAIASYSSLLVVLAIARTGTLTGNSLAGTSSNFMESKVERPMTSDESAGTIDNGQKPENTAPSIASQLCFVFDHLTTLLLIRSEYINLYHGVGTRGTHGRNVLPMHHGGHYQGRRQLR